MPAGTFLIDTGASCTCVDPALLADVQAHICECHHCEVVLDTTRQTIAIYRENEIYEFPTELRERLHAAIMARCRPTP